MLLSNFLSHLFGYDAKEQNYKSIISTMQKKMSGEVRVPSQFHAWLKWKSRKLGKSINETILYCVEESYKREKEEWLQDIERERQEWIEIITNG